MPGAMDFGIADDGERAGREQAAQVAIASFADIAEPVLAAEDPRRSFHRRLRKRGCGASLFRVCTLELATQKPW